MLKASHISFKSVTIPQREDPRLAQLAKRCDTCRPKGMFRSADDEFLLCYDGMSMPNVSCTS
jgi:RHO1 GDP-GTP exchange protein 1/2